MAGFEAPNDNWKKLRSGFREAATIGRTLLKKHGGQELKRLEDVFGKLRLNVNECKSWRRSRNSNGMLMPFLRISRLLKWRARCNLWAQKTWSAPPHNVTP